MLLESDEKLTLVQIEKLNRYDVLCEKGQKGMTISETKEWWNLNDWMIKNDLSLFDLRRIQ